VVVLLDDSHAFSRLRRFAGYLAGISVGLLLLMTATPLARAWFIHVAALPPALATMATTGLWFLLPMPAFRVFQTFYQGILLNVRRTRGVTESVALYILVSVTVLWAGVGWGQAAGLYVAVVGVLLGELLPVIWLRFRASAAMREREQAEQLAGETLLSHSKAALNR
jgi:Na+-driven multidrug efflux pump